MADLSKFSDFSLGGPSSESPNKKKFSKEDFLNAKKGLQEDTANPDDPLSQLDPLWSLKWTEMWFYSRYDNKVGIYDKNLD